MKLTQKRLKEVLEYNPETGDFVWLVSNGIKNQKGVIAGCDIITGYRSIGIDGSNHFSHRLAFLYMNGKIPDTCDHKNRVRSDNRWCNLRPATRSDNSRNRSRKITSTTGYHGVSYSKSRDKFRSSIRVDGKRIHIGMFTCKHHAFCEYVVASRKYHGEFSAV